MNDNRIQFRIGKDDEDIQDALYGYDNRTDRVKELIRYGMIHEETNKALKEGKIVIRSGGVKLTEQQKHFIHITNKMRKKVVT